MNTKFRLGIGMLFLIIMSCNPIEEDSILKENSTDVNEMNFIPLQNGGNDICVTISGNAAPIQFNGEERLFTASSSQNFSIVWSAVSNAQIIGSNSNETVRIRFINRNIGATFEAVIDGGRCIETINIGRFGLNCPAGTPSPGAIYSQFGTPHAPGYVEGNLGSNPICVNTINNQLSVHFDECYSYEWSITPSGPNIAEIFPEDRGNAAFVGVKIPGRYTVRLRTTNISGGSQLDTFILNAVSCNGFGGGF
ncbi:MAG: hypothetical protein AAF039_03635 [Bacteroidota bacterium]